MSGNNPFRCSHILDDKWRFALDPNSEGERGNWYTTSFNDSDWAEIEVPSVWEAQGYTEYDGVAWYRKRFRLSNEFSNKRIQIEFGAVDYFTKVWLNGEFLGEHEGGYTPFRFDATDLIDLTEDNVLAVRVFDPDPRSKDFPPLEILDGKQGWNAFPSPPSEYLRVGGIWQPVRVLGVPIAVRMERAVVEKIQTAEGLIKLKVNFEIGAPDKMGGNDPLLSREKVLVVEIVPFNFGGDTQKEEYDVRFDEGGAEASFSIKLTNPREWSLSNPDLYLARLTLRIDGREVDECSLKFGVREFSAKNGTFYLDGKPLFLRGALVQGFYPSTLYVAPSEEEIRKEISLAKMAGLNFLRLHIKIFEPAYLDIADECGMLLWVELPVIAPKKLTAQFNARALKELQDMVKRDICHPSIVIWGLFNELGAYSSPTSAEYNTSLNLLGEEIRKLDQTRLVCQDSWVEQPRIGDFADGHWYFEIPRQTPELEKRIQGIRRQPFIVSEFGGWGLPDFNLADSSIPRPFLKDGPEIKAYLEKYDVFKRAFDGFDEYIAQTQELQGLALAQQIKSFRTSNKIAGYVLTEFYDVPCEYNGILDYFRNRKKAYDHVARANREIFFILPPDMRVVLAQKKTAVTLTIVNDSEQRLQNGKVHYDLHLMSEEGEENGVIAHGVHPIHEALPHESKIIELSVDTSGTNTVRHFKLKTGLFAEGITSPPYSESFDLLAVSKEWLTLSNVKTCLIGEDERVVSLLQTVGAHTEGFSDDLAERLSQFNAVIIAGNLSELVSKDLQKRLDAYLREGGRVVVLAQTRKFELFGLEYSVNTLPEPWVTPFHITSPSSLTSGFRPGLQTYEFVGIYPRYVLKSVFEDWEIAACTIVASQVRKFMGVTLAKRKVGHGDLILCQYELSDVSNIAALMVMRNLLYE